MDDYKKTCKIGQEGLSDLLPLLNQTAFNGRFVITDKGNLSEFLQRSVGDVIFNCKNQKVWTVEIKTELENKYGNFFLEAWSNLSRYTLGWMFTLNTDFLWYYFRREKTLYSMQFDKLRQWAFQNHNIYKYPIKKQKKNYQLNDGWGWCVPIQEIESQVGFKFFAVEDNKPTP